MNGCAWMLFALSFSIAFAKPTSTNKKPPVVYVPRPYHWKIYTPEPGVWTRSIIRKSRKMTMPIPYKLEGFGDRLFGSGKEVTISNIKSASYEGDRWVGLELAYPFGSEIVPACILHHAEGASYVNPSPPVIDGPISLGVIPRGTEIVFDIFAFDKMRSRETANVVEWTLYNGPGDRNPDRRVHSRISRIDANRVHVGFNYLHYVTQSIAGSERIPDPCVDFEFDVSNVENPASVPVTRALAFVKPPTTLPPTVRERRFPDGDKLRAYDLRPSASPRKIFIQATEKGQPLAKSMRIRVSVRALDAGEGRDPSAQTQPRPHGWISLDAPTGVNVPDSPNPDSLDATDAATNPAPASDPAKATAPAEDAPLVILSDSSSEPASSPSAPSEPSAEAPPAESAPNASVGSDSPNHLAPTSGEEPEAHPSDSQDSSFESPTEFDPKALTLPSFAESVAFVEPGGETRDASLVLTTDADGRASFFYTPSEIAGTDLLVAESLDDAFVEPAQAPIPVRVEGLVNLARYKFAWAPVQTKAEKSLHPDSRWASPATVEALKRAAKLYVDRQANDRELQGWISTLAKKGYDFPFDLAKNRVCPSLAEPLLIQDVSLPGGGLLDVDGSYSAPHGGHRDGTDVDFQTKHLARGNPERATLAEATGDADLVASGDVERNDLAKRVQLRRLELLMKSLKDAGGRIVREDIDFHETLRHGEYLHVSFRPAESQAKDGDGKSATEK